MKREDVYRMIDSERVYQDKKWSKDNHKESRDSLDRTIDEFATYIQGYTNQLIEVCSRTDEGEPKLEVIRKITALGVACGEKHGLPERIDYENN